MVAIPLPFNSGPALPVPFFGHTIRTAVEEAIDFSSMTNTAAATVMLAASLEGPERSFPELASDAQGVTCGYDEALHRAIPQRRRATEEAGQVLALISDAYSGRRRSLSYFDGRKDN